MDLVFKRYQNPYFFDLAIENSKLIEFVDMLLKKQDEEKLWEIYVATAIFNEKSFEDWKKEVLKAKTYNPKMQIISAKKSKEIIAKSEDILRVFKPPNDREVR